MEKAEYGQIGRKENAQLGKIYDREVGVPGNSLIVWIIVWMQLLSGCCFEANPNYFLIPGTPTYTHTYFNSVILLTVSNRACQACKHWCSPVKTAEGCIYMISVTLAQANTMTTAAQMIKTLHRLRLLGYVSIYHTVLNDCSKSHA